MSRDPLGEGYLIRARSDRGHVKRREIVIVAVIGLSAFFIGGLVAMLQGGLQVERSKLPSDIESIVDAERGKVLVIDLMNTNCPPCKKQVAELRKFSEVKGGNVVIYSLSIEYPGFEKDTEENIRRFAAENGVSWKILVAQRPYEIISKLGIVGIPATLVIDRYGNVVFLHIGVIDADSLKEITSRYE